jgi:hypothetical protein
VIQDAVNALNNNLSKQRGVCKECMRNGSACTFSPISMFSLPAIP